MLLLNAGIFILGMVIMFLLLRLYKKLVRKKEAKPECDFKFSKIKYRQRENKQTASFNLSVSEKHTFFVDFPILFKFHSDTRFKGKIRITYKASLNSALLHQSRFYE